MKNDFIPATLNSELINEKLGLDVVRKRTGAKLDVMAKMSCGFAGFNGVCIFRKYKEN